MLLNILIFQSDTCKLKPKGSSYRGNESKTRKGVTCQKWDAQQPHSHGITPYTHKNAGLDKNFCRNPDGEPGGPWCYTTSPDKRWAYCDVLLCGKCSLFMVFPFLCDSLSLSLSFSPLVLFTTSSISVAQSPLRLQETGWTSELDPHICSLLFLYVSHSSSKNFWLK